MAVAARCTTPGCSRGPRGVGKASFARWRRDAGAGRGCRANGRCTGPGDARGSSRSAAGARREATPICAGWNGSRTRRTGSCPQHHRRPGAFARRTVRPDARMSPWRAVVIDTVDDLETRPPTRLLKDAGRAAGQYVFLLVSHVARRLLPTIRSRCRRLDFQPLDDDAMASVLERASDSALPSARLVPAAGGSAGTGARLACARSRRVRGGSRGASCATAIATMPARSELATGVGRQGRGRPLCRLPGNRAGADRPGGPDMEERPRRRALDAYARARETSRLRRGCRSIRRQPCSSWADPRLGCPLPEGPPR